MTAKKIDPVPVVPEKPLVVMAKQPVVTFKEPLIIPEFCFQNLLLPGQPIPSGAFKVTQQNN